MPVTKSAKKTLRQEIKKRKENKKVEDTLKKLLKSAKNSPTIDSIKNASQAADKAVKKHIIHKNKASRLKSMLAKLITSRENTTKQPIKKLPLKKKKQPRK